MMLNKQIAAALGASEATVKRHPGNEKDAGSILVSDRQNSGQTEVITYPTLRESISLAGLSMVGIKSPKVSFSQPKV